MQSFINNAESAFALSQLLIESVSNREPDFVIGDDSDPYMLRWHLQRSEAESSIYLHCILRDDDDRALHDHRGHTASIVLRGILREVLKDSSRLLDAGSITYREAEVGHRLEVEAGPVWTLFVTGPTIREWGFHCPQGWRHWKEFTAPDEKGLIGRGCD